MSGERLVEREVFVRAARPDVFAMFVDPAKLVTWLGISAGLDPEPGGLFRFEITAGEFCSGRYVEVEPPRRVAFTWGWEGDEIPIAPGSTLVEVELTEADGGTLVRLTHSRLPDAFAELHADGWRQFLARLAAVLEERDPGPDPARERPREALERLRTEGTET